MLFGRVGIDMIAGPTDSLILADKTADPDVVATDLVARPNMATTRRSGWSRMTATWPKRS
jgi:histidinol dehydrogenase